VSLLCLTLDDNSHAIFAGNQGCESSTAPPSIEGGATDLVFRVQQALRDTHLPELAFVEVEIRYGRMHLRGSVTSWYLKQSAQSAARRVDPSMLLINLIRVVASSSLDGDGLKTSDQQGSGYAGADAPLNQ
jgi:hypothetical protein